jgi:hypothetical protein
MLSHASIGLVVAELPSVIYIHSLLLLRTQTYDLGTLGSDVQGTIEEPQGIYLIYIYHRT